MEELLLREDPPVSHRLKITYFQFFITTIVCINIIHIVLILYDITFIDNIIIYNVIMFIFYLIEKNLEKNLGIRIIENIFNILFGILCCFGIYSNILGGKIHNGQVN